MTSPSPEPRLPPVEKICPYCEAIISATAQKCKYCGEWVMKKPENRFVDIPPAPSKYVYKGIPTSTSSKYAIIDTLPSIPSSKSTIEKPPATPPKPATTYTPPAAPNREVIYVKNTSKGSPIFAVATFIFYLFFYPVGLALNLIGLLTGPRRGCFFWLLIVFVGLPLFAIIFLGLEISDLMSVIGDLLSEFGIY